uniref:Uncharacterized protein LOC111110516 n=1 Tax=Crassostrea virginica TaxID=6565 RepID=A0A8B8BIV1_CRAVI|nr:uncharacterized protein LOC111110516 [Crassostrea virginica]
MTVYERANFTVLSLNLPLQYLFKCVQFDFVKINERGFPGTVCHPCKAQPFYETLHIMKRTSEMLEYIFILIQFFRVTHPGTVTEWHFGMKIVSNGSSGVQELYQDPCLCNGSVSTLEDLKARPTEHFKSCAMSLLPKAVRIRLDVYKMDEVKASFLFGRRTSSNGNWFLGNNLISHTYDESIKEEQFLFGSEIFFFQIYEKSDENCKSRRFFFRVIDVSKMNNPLSFCTSLPVKVWVLYSPEQNMVLYEELEIADYMTIHLQTERTVLEGDDLASWIVQTKDNLSVQANSTSSFKRTKVSVYESRQSAVSMGVCGAACIACVLGLIVMADIANILKK